MSEKIVLLSSEKTEPPKLPEDFYSSMTWHRRDTVISWLKYKCLMDNVIYSDDKYDSLCTKYLADDQKDQYIIRTRGHITASKTKKYMKSQEEYYFKYVLELPEFQPKDSKALRQWTAFDTLVSKWMEEFNNRYYTDKWYVKGELATLIASRDGGDPKKIEKDNNLEQLRDKRYKAGDKLRLTPAEARDVMGMYHEYMRQEQMDGWSEYIWHYYVETKFGTLTISWTLDRFSLQKLLIRDSKTSWRIERIERDINETFDYVTQMAFYFLLIYMQQKVECDVLLDIISSSAPYQSIIYKMSAEKLRRKLNSEIIPALKMLEQSHIHDIRQPSNRFVAMESSYYPIMQSSKISELIESN